MHGHNRSLITGIVLFYWRHLRFMKRESSEGWTERMSSSAFHDDERERPRPIERLSRRRFLVATGSVGSAAVVSTVFPGPSAAAPTTASFSKPERAMVLQMARVGAHVPISFPDFDATGPGAARATAPRLLAAERRLSSSRTSWSFAEWLMELAALRASRLDHVWTRRGMDQPMRFSDHCSNFRPASVDSSPTSLPR